MIGDSCPFCQAKDDYSHVSACPLFKPGLRKTEVPVIGGAIIQNKDRGPSTVLFHAPIYTMYLPPAGVLTMDTECHALFHYAITAVNNWKEEKETIKLEKEAEWYNYWGLYKGIARMYDADPHKMQNFWFVVDTQMELLKLTVLPKEKKYRAPSSSLSVIKV